MDNYRKITNPFSQKSALDATLRQRTSYLVMSVQCLVIVTILFLMVVSGSASAQIFQDGGDGPNVAGSAAGWWSPDTAVSKSRSQLMIDMTQLARFASAGAPQAAAGTTIGGWMHVAAGLPDINSDDTASGPGLGNLQAAIYGVSAPESEVFGLLRTHYERWLARLSDSRSLTDVHGLLVYPLVEVNYSTQLLPVTLYIPPLRGSAE